jgi:hypothetical protein
MATTASLTPEARLFEPGTGEQRALARLPHASIPLRNELRSFFDAQAKTALGTPAALHTSRLIAGLQTISNQEYRALVGLITACRSEDLPIRPAFSELLTSNRLTGALRNVLTELNTLHEVQFSRKNALALVNFGSTPRDQTLEGSFLESAIKVIRLCYPLGVNVLNPNWDPATGPTNLHGNQSVVVWLTNERDGTPTPRLDAGVLALRPTGDGAATELKFLPPGMTWSQVSSRVRLDEDRTLLVGRTLLLGPAAGEQHSEIFGVQAPSLMLRPELQTVATDQSDVKNWSRCGILFARREGKITILDRGSLYGIASPLKSGGCLSYTPRTIVTAEGRSYGETSLHRGSNHSGLVEKLLS